MAIEIERKFLVRDASILKGLAGVPITQGYLSEDSMPVRVRIAGPRGLITLGGRAPGSLPEFEYEIPVDDALLLTRHTQQGFVRGMAVRVRMAGPKGLLTLKGRNPGISRPEFEYEIPADDALLLLARHARPGLIKKTRFEVPLGTRHIFEVDVYDAPLEGLVTAEIEMESEDEDVPLPQWLGVEVSDDVRYSNDELAAAGRLPE